MLFSTGNNSSCPKRSWRKWAAGSEKLFSPEMGTEWIIDGLSWNAFLWIYFACIISASNCANCCSANMVVWWQRDAFGLRCEMRVGSVDWMLRRAFQFPGAGDVIVCFRRPAPTCSTAGIMFFDFYSAFDTKPALISENLQKILGNFSTNAWIIDRLTDRLQFVCGGEGGVQHRSTSEDWTLAVLLLTQHTSDKSGLEGIVDGKYTINHLSLIGVRMGNMLLPATAKLSCLSYRFRFLRGKASFTYVSTLYALVPWRDSVASSSLIVEVTNLHVCLSSDVLVFFSLSHFSPLGGVFRLETSVGLDRVRSI